ncbi:MAG: serine--tRNA ligase [Elusimicrobiales bacterium]|nr:serine--tRNA ligase [Elusimicrobiales bacterium]
MIDIKTLRTNPNLIEDSIIKRGGRYLPAFKELVEKDRIRLEMLKELEKLNKRRNEIAREIANLKKDNIEIPKAKIDEANSIKNSISELEENLKKLDSEVNYLLLSIPNILDSSVPYGKSDEDNKVVYENTSFKRKFDFKPLSHWELGEKIGILDFETASALSGSRFALLKGKGASLERALINFMLDLHTKEHGYQEVFPPFLVNRKTMTGTGQLPKFEEDLYKIQGEPELFLIPTAEVPLTNMYADKILREDELPKQFTAYTACFRQEAGSYGKDTKGLIRNHQFNKVELVWITTPEKSNETLEVMTKHAQRVLELLELPYRVVQLCSGDLGFASSKTYDIEVWMPSENRFREISSCSNCKDFQARRMNTRFRRDDGKIEYVHTLNGSGLAVGRTFAAIVENYQNADGSISIPKALVKYMGFDRI